jgi:hypothetical protein
LVYVFWYKLFYDQIESTHHEGKDFLMDHFDIPNANILGDLWMTSKSIEAISDIPEIKAKFKSYNNVPVPEIDHGGKLHITPRCGIDSIELIDIFDLIREYLLKQVQSLDSNQEELTNRLSEIQGDLYELRQSANRLLEKNIKNTNEATIFIVALVIVAIIIIGYFYVST